MAEVNAKDAKLIQWLNEAYGKEKQLETALALHIQLAEPATYKKRLQQHLKETKGHAREIERRVKKLGGKAEVGDLPGPDVVSGGLTAVANVAGRAVAQAQGAVQAARGTSDAEKRLKNAKDELHEEAEEIANYTALIALAENVGDKDTAKMAKSILREEQRMYDYVHKQIPKLTKEVVKTEIPKDELPSRSGSRSSSSRSSSSSSSRSRSSSNGSNGSSPSGKSTARKAAKTAEKTAKTAGKTAKTAAKSGSTAVGKTAKTAQSSTKTAAKRTATTARKSSSGSSAKASSGGSRSRKKS